VCTFSDTKPDSYTYHIGRQEALSEWLEKAVSSTVYEKIEQIKAVVSEYELFL